MTAEEIKAAYKTALDDVTAKKAAVETTQAAYSAACAELDVSERAAADLLAKLQAAIVAGSL